MYGVVLLDGGLFRWLGMLVVYECVRSPITCSPSRAYTSINCIRKIFFAAAGASFVIMIWMRELAMRFVWSMEWRLPPKQIQSQSYIQTIKPTLSSLALQRCGLASVGQTLFSQQSINIIYPDVVIEYLSIAQIILRSAAIESTKCTMHYATPGAKLPRRGVDVICCVCLFVYPLSSMLSV